MRDFVTWNEPEDSCVVDKLEGVLMKSKKIKFTLELLDGEKVHDLEEMRKHFDQKKIMGYYMDGRLLEWLNDRYYTAIAKAVEKLDKNSSNIARKLCAILGVAYTPMDMSEEDIDTINKKESKLRQLTADTVVIECAKYTAFTQVDLDELIDLGRDVIYLCGKAFRISGDIENCRYIGLIDQPYISIDVESYEELVEKNIFFENVILPEHLKPAKRKVLSLSADVFKSVHNKAPSNYQGSALFRESMTQKEHEEADKIYSNVLDIMDDAFVDLDKLIAGENVDDLKSMVKKYIKYYSEETNASVLRIYHISPAEVVIKRRVIADLIELSDFDKDTILSIVGNVGVFQN